MLDAIMQTLTEVMKSNLWLAPLAAFVGGSLTAANPCVIAAIPLMMAYLAGQETGERKVLRSFLLSLTFALGLTIMFAVMYLGVVAASSVVGGYWNYVAVVVCLVMGLHLMGVVHFTIPAPAGVKPSQRGFVGALLLGLLFGLISMPCAGPILLVLLSLIPMHGKAYGALLLVGYSLGHSLLIILGGMSMGLVQKMITSGSVQSATLWLKRFAGLAAIAVGLYLLLVGG